MEEHTLSSLIFMALISSGKISTPTPIDVTPTDAISWESVGLLVSL